MASTYSTNLALELIGTGDQAGTWGNTTNTNLGTLIEQAISGYVTQAVSTGTDTTLTIPNGATGVARNMYIELTGTGGTNTNLVVPANKKLYFIYNNASGAVTVKVSGQTGVSVAAGQKVILVSNGTDVVEATTYLASNVSSLSLTNLTAVSLTVSGNSFLATSSGNVGIGTSSPSSATWSKFVAVEATYPGIVFNSTAGGGKKWSIGADAAVLTFRNETDSTTAAVIDGSNNVGIGTASPATRLHVQLEAATETDIARFRVTNGANNHFLDIGADEPNKLVIFDSTGSAAGGYVFRAGGTDRMRLDTSGNLGLGVTPSAFGSAYKAFQFGTTGALYGESGDAAVYLACNAFIDSGGANKYITSDFATRYNQENGVHKWNIAPSGTAGDTISFTQAMTLDAAGRLGIGQTSPGVALSVAGASETWQLALATNNSTSGAVIGSPAADVIAFGNWAGTERARVTSTGNLLVGTTTDVSGRSGVISDVAGNVRAIPRTGSAKTSVYTLTVSDVGQFVELGTGGAIDVPNGIFATGDVVSVFNNTTGNRTISLTITTAYIGGTDADKASVTLATRGVATILFISNSVCVVNGNVS